MESMWNATLHPRSWTTKLLVTDPQQDEILKAVLPTPPRHPRAMLTLLEGLALWSGMPITAAICVGETSGPLPDEALYDGAIAPSDSALVRFVIADDVVRRRRLLTGLGDFRQLRLLHARRA